MRENADQRNSKYGHALRSVGLYQIFLQDYLTAKSRYLREKV